MQQEHFQAKGKLMETSAKDALGPICRPQIHACRAVESL